MTKQYFRSHKRVELKRKLDNLTRKAKRRIRRAAFERELISQIEATSKITDLAESLARKVKL